MFSYNNPSQTIEPALKPSSNSPRWTGARRAASAEPQSDSQFDGAAIHAAIASTACFSMPMKPCQCSA